MLLPRSLLVGARQKFGSSGEATHSVPHTRNDSMLPEILAMRRRKPSPFTVTASGVSRTVNGGISVVSMRGAGGTSKGILNCSHAATWLAFAHSVSSANAKRKVSQYSIPGSNAGGSKGTVTSRAAFGATSSPGRRPLCTTSPSAASSHVASKDARFRKAYLFRIRILPAVKSTGSTAMFW